MCKLAQRHFEPKGRQEALVYYPIALNLIPHLGESPMLGIAVFFSNLLIANPLPERTSSTNPNMLENCLLKFHYQ